MQVLSTLTLPDRRQASTANKGPVTCADATSMHGLGATLGSIVYCITSRLRSSNSFSVNEAD
jgi:hypothetical protein